jgi:hypothetical protein
LQVARLQAQLEQQSATVAAAHVSLKMDKESREFFEALMVKESPHASQKHLKLLIENQLAVIRSKKGRSPVS